MRFGRWIDHIPLWLALGAVASTGFYEPAEVVQMAVPLVAGALVELTRRDLGRFRVALELVALGIVGADFLTRRGLFPLVVHSLFLLAGVRLMLPRQLPQRRQLLLIGFLAVLTTAISTTDPAFLAFGLAFGLAATAALLQQAWEGSASLRRGPLQPAPFRKAPLWLAGATVLGAGFFVIMPRITLGLRPAPWWGLRAGAAAGLSDRLDLGGEGPLQDNPEVVLRVVAPRDLDAPGVEAWRAGAAEELGLLRGLALEALDENGWRPVDFRGRTPFEAPRARSRGRRSAEFFFSPGPKQLIPLPYTFSDLLSPPPVPLARGAGGSWRWQFPTGRAQSLMVQWELREPVIQEAPLHPRRREFLTAVQPVHQSVARWCLRMAPDILTPRALAERLSAQLHTFRYTLDNPSGGAADPLGDFLERTRAGHCEYFASALAVALRSRGVPARVVNGYRLGAWIPEGNYFRVTQNEAHSWVEYLDDDGAWHPADPTPASPLADASRESWSQRWARLSDAMHFQWDRYVVRFSDEDQQKAAHWAQTRLKGWRMPDTRILRALALAAAAGWLAWRFRTRLRGWLTPKPKGPAGIAALRPLLRRTRKEAPPLPGETARAWLERLARQRPARREPFTRLADAVDAAAYGGGGEAALRPLVSEAAKAWKD